MIECKIGLAGVLGANAANEIKEIEAMAMGQLKSCQQYPVQRPATDVVWQWQLWMGFDVSIRANVSQTTVQSSLWLMIVIDIRVRANQPVLL
ncbi:hypothetical protein DL93DRAFT_2071334 [Clavulina sp. PMI_390]|nr:hypothetical protein DL93DRAFT_2071334 [Clavulina sp. PMI_390]